MSFLHLTNLVELCARKGIRHALLCPGSRSAPLTLAFSRNRKIKCWTFSDERSAAFIAIGMAHQTHLPVALVCTSGSAAYNFAPAVAEAYFQRIPLIVFTADRPKEWIDQFDGQTIRQKELYGNHVKQYFELPQDYTHPDSIWFANRIINEAINLCQSGNKGPVHINAPFREPLYPSGAQKSERKPIRVIEPAKGQTTLQPAESKALVQALRRFKKILIVCGQNDTDPALLKTLTDFHSAYHCPVAGDILANLHSLPFFCRHADTFLGSPEDFEKQQLRPDLLITFGKSLVAKQLKLFLRKFPPAEQWHLQPAGAPADTFQCLTKVIPVEPNTFFREMIQSRVPVEKSWAEFDLLWAHAEKKARKKTEVFFKIKRKGEFALVNQLLTSLPQRCHLHLANSMAVRYANHIGLDPSQKNVSVYSNRGTSGIDGCSSTTVGHALTSRIPNVLITGDLAFFYDRNAFWHNYNLPNLFIVVLNNHGGIIFNLIDGPSGLKEAEEFFITKQKLTARALASEFGFKYHEASRTHLKEFFKPYRTAKILEIDSSQSVNKSIFEAFKKNRKL